jgi:hypothetical protein
VVILAPEELELELSSSSDDEDDDDDSTTTLLTRFFGRGMVEAEE